MKTKINIICKGVACNAPTLIATALALALVISCGDSKTFTDPRDGKKYKYTTIGEQVWMAQNLDFAGEGDSLGRCFNDSIGNCEKYGHLYNWETALKVCPEGWHLPSNEEWKTLTDFVGLRAGARLKAKDGGWGWRNWGLPNDNVDKNVDEFDFSALPSGYGNEHGFNDAGTKGVWWSATEDEDDYAITRMIRTSNITGDNGLDVGRYFLSKKDFNSVRCVKGEPVVSAAPVAEKIKCPEYDARTHLCDNRDGKVYKYAKFLNEDKKEEIWMTENLNYEIANSECYDNEPTNCEKYGRLYNHDAVYEDICPENWHVPKNLPSGATSEDFSILFSGFGNADGSFSEIDNYTGWWDRSWDNYYTYVYYVYRSVFGNTADIRDGTKEFGACVHTWNGCKVYTLPVRCQKNPKCDTEYYDPYKQECCDNKTIYNQNKQTCKNGRVLNNSDLCDGNEYNRDKQFCYSFTEECRNDCGAPYIWRSEIIDKCGGKEYDYKKQECIKGVIKERLCGSEGYDPFWEFCHKNEVYQKCAGTDVYNPDKEFCGATCFFACGTSSYDVEGVIELCGGKEYNFETKFCYKDELYDRCSVLTDDEEDYEAHSCGDDKRCVYAEYNPETQACRNNSIVDLNLRGSE